MAWAVTDIGTARKDGMTAGTVVLTVAAGGIPQNAIVLAFVGEVADVVVTAGSIADTRSNTYTQITGRSLNNVQANGYLAAKYSLLATALQSGDSISFTRGGGDGVSGSISGCYITGNALSSPVDSGVTAVASGTSVINPAITSGTPNSANALIFASISTNFTLTADAGWTAVPAEQTSAPRLVNGYKANVSTAQTYTTDTGGMLVTNYAMITVGFKLPTSAFSYGFFLG